MRRVDHGFEYAELNAVPNALNSSPQVRHARHGFEPAELNGVPIALNPSPQVRHALAELVKSGMWGETLADCAEELVRLQLRKLNRRGGRV